MMPDQNIHFPGRADYVGACVGVALALHHDRMAEPTWDVLERVDVVRREKPEHERASRLWQMVMPDQARLPEAVRMAWAEWDRAGAKYDRAGAECSRAGAEYSRACAAHAAELLALLAEYVPDHTWDGKRFVYPEA